jgi:hypothetical protein
MILELGPFSRAGIPALQSLGEAADRGTPAVKAARPVITDLRHLATAAKPVGRDARLFLESFQSTGGIERAMDYVFYQASSINGFDSVGHYLRAALIVNPCTNYAVTPVLGCSANFSSASATSALKAAQASGDPTLERTALALTGKPSAKKARRHRTRSQAAARAQAQATPQATATPTATATPAPATSEQQTDTLLDYLFGGDG